MATIDIKLKSYDELIFEITKLNTDKYLLETENKQLRKVLRINHQIIDMYVERIDNVNKYIDDLLEKDNDKTILQAIKFMLGDKENE